MEENGIATSYKLDTCKRFKYKLLKEHKLKRTKNNDGWSLKNVKMTNY